MMQEVSWGVVTSVSPVEVRFPGDTADTAIGFVNEDLTLSTSDRVLLAKTGSRDGWVIVCVLVAT